MYKELIFVYLAITLTFVSTTEAKGGRSSSGGGRSSSRSSSSGGGFFSSRSSSGKSYSSSSSSGKSYSSSSSSGSSGSRSSVGKSSTNNWGGSRTSGDFFHGFFHSSPYHYNRPSHITTSSTNSNYASNRNEEELNEDTNNYAMGYSISRALNSDFYSIFNVVRDISKYPESFKNKALLDTTTESPVSTYDLNEIIKPSTTTIPSTIFEVDPKPHENDIFEVTTSKKNLHTNFGYIENIYIGDIYEEKSVETTTNINDEDLDRVLNNLKYKLNLWDTNSYSMSNVNNGISRYPNIYKEPAVETTTKKFIWNFPNKEDEELNRFLNNIQSKISLYSG